MKFKIQIPGKWILAGEHAVVRGASALVFPLGARTLDLETESQESKTFLMQIQSEDPGLKNAAELACEAALAYFKEKKIPLTEQKISILIHSQIPVGSGLGSSAALSVGLAKIFNTFNFISEDQIFPLAHRMENQFHGNSSGLDIAAVSQEGPILFKRGPSFNPVYLKWKPLFYLSDSGLRASTKSCVEKVTALHLPMVDQQMQLAVSLAETALTYDSANDGNPLLKESIVLAQACFRSWQLVPIQAQEAIDQLLGAGALACKLTGSGNGGFILSLWEKPPPENLSSLLIRAL